MLDDKEICSLFEQIKCTGSVFAKSLISGKNISFNGDVLQTPASVFKVPLVLAMFYLAEQKILNLSKKFQIVGGKIPVQAAGISQFKHPVEIVLEDLAYFCLALSDAESTDIILNEVGIDRFNTFLSAWGMKNTFISGGISSIVSDHCKSLGFHSWDHLVEATSGNYGEQLENVAHGNTTDFYRSVIFDPTCHSKTSAYDCVSLLESIYKKNIASPYSCQKTLELMNKQVNNARIASGFDDKTIVYAKSGSLFRHVRNEIAIIKLSKDDVFAVAIFTRSKNREVDGRMIDRYIGKIAAFAIDQLK